MRLTDIRDALLTLGVPVHHYFAKNATSKYIVWAEDGEAGAIHADNIKQSQVIEGTIHYLTKTEYDPIAYQIGLADDDGNIADDCILNSLEISWRLNSIQYEKDTGYIHYEWVFQVI